LNDQKLRCCRHFMGNTKQKTLFLVFICTGIFSSCFKIFATFPLFSRHSAPRKPKKTNKAQANLSGSVAQCLQHCGVHPSSAYSIFPIRVITLALISRTFFLVCLVNLRECRGLCFPVTAGAAMKSIVYSMRDGEGIKLANRNMNPYNASLNKDSIHCKVICAGKPGCTYEMVHQELRIHSRPASSNSSF
jgi:hypothetical protein